MYNREYIRDYLLLGKINQYDIHMSQFIKQSNNIFRINLIHNRMIIHVLISLTKGNFDKSLQIFKLAINIRQALLLLAIFQVQGVKISPALRVKNLFSLMLWKLLGAEES